MKTMTKVSEEVLDFLEMYASYYTKHEDELDDGWYYLPYWFKREGDKLASYSFSELPEELVDALQDNRK